MNDGPACSWLVMKPQGVVPRRWRSCSATIAAALLLLVVLTFFMLQSLYVWCDTPDAASYAQQLAPGSSGSMWMMSSTQVSVKGAVCIASSHVLRVHNYLVNSGAAAVQVASTCACASCSTDGGACLGAVVVEGDRGLLQSHIVYSGGTTDGRVDVASLGPGDVDSEGLAANLESWKSQWERRNLSRSLRREEMELLPDGLMTADIDMFLTNNVAVGGPGSQAKSCNRRPGPAWLSVDAADSVACPVLWECAQPGGTPKVLAVCLDTAFWDAPRAATLPTESATGSTTPALGEGTLRHYDQFASSVVFLANVYTNYLAQMFDSRVTYLRGGCWEVPFRDTPLVQSNATRIHRHALTINLCSHHAGSQFHGLIELYSRIVVLAPVIRALPAARVLVTDRDVKRVDELLKLAGFPSGLASEEVRVHRVRPGELVYSDVAVAAHGPGCGKVSRSVWQHARRDYFGIRRDSRSMYRRGDAWYVLVAERTGSRAIAQHEALVAELKAALGERRVQLFSDKVAWTLQSTRELYSRATLFVAGHGAGLSNMVFMPDSSSVVEVRPSNFSNRCYHNLADALGFPYYRLDSPGTKSSTLNIDVGQVVDLVVAIVRAKGGMVPFYPGPIDRDLSRTR